MPSLPSSRSMSSREIALPRPAHPRAALAALCLIAAGVAAALALSGSSHPSPAAAHRHRAPVHRVALIAEAPDPLASKSFPDPAGARTHARAAAPWVAAAGAPSL